MRKIITTLIAVLFTTIAVFGTASTVSSQSEPTNVILIGWDGCQRNHLNESLNAGQLPNLSNLISNGIYLDTEVYMTGAREHKTATKPGWTEVLTGCSPAVTGIYSNKFYRPIPQGLTIFSKLKVLAPNIITVCLSAKTKHFKHSIGEPYYYEYNSCDIFSLGSDADVGNKALEMLDTYKDKQFFMFVLFCNPDEAGHRYGENSPEYTNAIINDDVWLGRIVGKLESLGLAGNTLIYVTPDHGFNENGTIHTKPILDTIKTWLVTNDLQASGVHYLIDITPTILHNF